MLEIRDLYVSYGVSPALKGVSITVATGELVAMLGANGAGKTTVLRTISGVIRARQGSITFRGESIFNTAAHRIAGLGLAHVPEGRGVLPTMTVLENLEMGGYLCRDKHVFGERLDKVLSLFPILAERRNLLGGTLSGGEQQMLAIGRALMGKPRLLLLDEPSMGLAPLIVEQIFDIVRSINAEGVSILLVEQNARQALSLANRGYVLETGELVLSGSGRELLADDRIRAAYLGEELAS
jgi:branched-chain amino acid transport system ATP-binding protein